MALIKGKVRKFGNDINTDEIIPAKYLTTTDAEVLGQYCMEGIRPGFSKMVQKGDIIVAGKNFGCGSSREHAPLSLKGCGISCVIAESFARIFFRNSINIGLPILESPEAAKKIKNGDLIEVDLERGAIKNRSTKEAYKIQGFPKFMQQLIDAGGLMQWVAKRVQRTEYREQKDTR